MARRPSKTPSRSAMGRKVIHNSPPQHPSQSDPLIASPLFYSRIETAGFDRDRPTRAGANPLEGEPLMTYTDGGPVRNAGGSESFNTVRMKRGRLSDSGKKGWKRNELGSGSVS
jgi:hypothetical protein